jgi:hypothetical protein
MIERPLLPSLLLVLLSTQSVADPRGPIQDGDAGREEARALPTPKLALSDLDRWRADILPAADELSYEAIPWIPDFAEGVREASKQGKPLLFWAMNGHPLGCT